jgi:hypothetical protein
MNNPQPLFYSPKTPIEKMMRFGKEEEHVKFSVSGHEALLFANSGSPPPHPDASHLSFLYTPTANGKLQFMIKDVKAS